MEFRPHISLNVADLEASVRFYRTVFAAEPTKHYTDYANFRLEKPALHLALVAQPGHVRSRGGGEHFGIEMFDAGQLAHWQSRAEAAGLPMRTESAVTCCYAVGNKFWLTDPDGNDWEFWVRTDEAQAMHSENRPQEQTCCAAAPAALPAKQTCCA
ncbi:ArsI/CadI family heavy metal resistance metalloenzyme [Gloeobacter morelensis]|uniref:Glyoxalase/bleomycin resistance/dioxygenase family protein n=1 Tax=Gloeobacter morelensis MG652769 TaxID=2781736 RepID=A0ABY3PTQ7_9CYAN|nr:ArsI/CadI family heavy metal resistance metalloenzyme [Gloeobacter morelensis]UFP96836.1 glyoxalase/bleomycin resistance/dioxygenase family protein [Gloeobacter morelensis MG652769]